ncbi:MAG: hypothetical protein PHP85_06385 [Gallionella sp.]|nr:hypothetical protein [Gallionella sp.]
MKKIVLSIAAVMAAAAFAPEASAVPVFARQTGMACSACHFQHFPLLNGFGRAFKSAGFTMMGAQGKVEGEHLELPNVLNMAVLSSAYYQNEKNTGGAAAPKIGVPGSGGELSIFFGGRISESAGFLSELGVGGPGAALGAAKLALLFPVADSRVGLVAYTGGQGAAYGFELLNTGAADTHKMMGNAGPNKQHVAAAYAGSYMGTRSNATGASLVASNDNLGFITVGKYASVGPGVGANTLPLTYVRAAGIFDLGGFDAGVGIQSFSGNMNALGLMQSAKATVVDAQLQGEVGGMGTGIYVTYATAPGDAVNANIMNAGWSPITKGGNAPVAALVQGTSTSFNIAGSLEVIPGIATLQAAVRRAKNGNYAQTGDNSIMIGATYELAQNIELGLNYTSNSGSAWNGLVNPMGKSATTLLLEALF